MLSKKQPSSSKPLPLRKLCTRCGKVHNRKAKCPTRDATCHRCHRKGHYESQCFSKTVSAVALEDSPTEDSFEDDITLTTQQPQGMRYLDCITTTQQKTWTVTILVGGKPTLFKLDTGAEVTAVSDKFFRTCTAQLQKPSQLLYGPGCYPIQVMEQFTETLQYKDRLSQQTMFVVRGLKTNLSGLPAITALKLAARIDAITDYQAIIEESFPTLFQGLGNLGEPYVIQLLPDVQPHALHVSRNVPLSLRDKVCDELNRMKSIGVISRIEQPTQWCAGMVANSKEEWISTYLCRPEANKQRSAT